MAERYFRQPSVMGAQQHFSTVPKAEILRSRFDRSHAVKTTFDAGYLVPVFLDEVLPGDTFTMNSTVFARLATPLRPIMDNLYMDIHYFFVPNRLVWDDWQKFMGERPTPGFDPNTVIFPKQPWAAQTATSDLQTVGTYFGLPRFAPNQDIDQQVSCLPFRAYKLIWNEWYRDENLRAPFEVEKGDYNPASDTDIGLVRRGKRYDYFTSCLPWPQKGDPVTIPIIGDAQVYSYGNQPLAAGLGFVDTGTSTFVPVNITGNNATSGAVQYNGATSAWATGTTEPMHFQQNLPFGFADMEDISAVSVNDLRTAFQIQKLLERDARGGTRYIELILSHFGVASDDARLQRPELLGFGTTRININPIASTATVVGTAPQANLAAVGTSVLNGRFQKSFTEHGLIIGLASVRADLTYQQGIDRMWSRTTRYDFYWPSLAHLGEQAVLSKEIFYSGGADDELVFGYQERYAEYRYKPSLVTGQFNSNCSTPLDTWHLAQDFATRPALNGSFIAENPPVGRISAVPSEPDFLVDIWHNLFCDRPMPVYSVPGLIDHF